VSVSRTFSLVHVEAHVAGRSRKVSVFSERDVLPRIGIDEQFGQTEVNYVNNVSLAWTPTNGNVFWLDVSKHVALRVDVLHSTDLQCQRISTCRARQ